MIESGAERSSFKRLYKVLKYTCPQKIVRAAREQQLLLSKEGGISAFNDPHPKTGLELPAPRPTIAKPAVREESERMTGELDALSELKDLCCAWRSANDPSTFTQILKTCLAAKVITPLEFRDRLSLMPKITLFWASGKASAPLSMQEEVVDFISDHIEKIIPSAPRVFSR